MYFGYASLALPASHPDRSTTSESDSAYQIYPMVMSIGYNPFYKNTVRSAEVHILHKFAGDFYGAHMRLLILGFIREEKDYKSLDALIAKADAAEDKKKQQKKLKNNKGEAVEVEKKEKAKESPKDDGYGHC